MVRFSFAVVLASLAGCSAPEEPSSGAKPDSTALDTGRDGRGELLDVPVREDVSVGDSRPDAPGKDAPPPIEDVLTKDDFGLPPDGSRVEGTIGPEGGTISGVTGTALSGVSLVVPKGALSKDVLFALDALPEPIGPGGAKLVSPYVRVGPEGVAFAVPARLTLPWSTTTPSPQIAMVARIGLAWSSLLDPEGDATAKTITASMRRTSGAAAVLLDLSGVAPKITAFAPSTAPEGSTVFVEGSGFGIAPIWRPGTPDFTSVVKVGGEPAKAIGWDPNAISILVPEGDGGVVTVTTPGGTATSSGSLAK